MVILRLWCAVLKVLYILDEGAFSIAKYGKYISNLEGNGK
jgi:hypothetical protein